MATIIQIKRSSGTSAPSSLKLGELAYTYGTGTQGNLGDRLFIGEGGVDGNGDANNVTVIGGEYFTSQLDHAGGTLTASSALLVDSNSAIDQIFIGNSSSTGGTLKLNEGTSNGSNFIGIKAPNAVTTTTTFTLPDGDGSSGQFLKTDGSGNLDFATVTSSFTLAADSGSNDSFSTGETLTIAGGTGIDTTVSDNQISIAIDGTVVTGSSTDTFTNKTFDANGTGNSISNIEVADLAASAVVTESESIASNDEDTSFPTSAAVKDYVDNATATLANKTLTAPKIADAGFIADANGNEQIVFQTTTSAVNQFEVTNAATGNGVTLGSAGSDSNIDIVLDPKGTGVVDVNTSRITNVTNPTGDQDAATKSYVDSVANGLDVKDSVRLASTANIAGTYNNSAGTITAGSNGAISIDGTTPSADDRVLVKNQTNEAQNGIYTVTTVGDGSNPYVLTRATDADTAAEITGGTFTFVEEGTANADTGFVFTHNGTPTLGTTDLTVSTFSSTGEITGGDGLTRSGLDLSVNVDDSSIEISSDSLRVKASGITNAMLAGSIANDKLAGSIANSKLSNSTVSISDDSSSSTSISLGGGFSILGGDEITTTLNGSELSLAVTNIDGGTF